MEHKTNEELNKYEIIVFNQEKELCSSSNQLINKHRNLIGKVDFTKVYRCIINYRIKKYGNGVVNNMYFYRTQQEKRYLQDLAKSRKRSRLGKK